MSSVKPLLELTKAQRRELKKDTIKIRLARFGRKHQPTYNIVVTNSRKAQQRLPIEVIGTYDSVPVKLPWSEEPVKDISLDFHRTKYWLGKGAEPTERVAWLLKKVGILPQFWPKESSNTKEIIRPIVEDIKEVQEIPVELTRKR
ncbi:unnamed protein product [Candida verbasci]|uniref:Mitochondrial ribosomal protein S16 n=1 Tax=Candida verbasci TaxID=1227364 RepID=A0A9W4XN97_9ASCO|nr:unnamed protein product [Candida verbasci]